MDLFNTTVDGIHLSMRTLAYQELDELVTWTTTEGWSLTLSDLQIMYNANPKAYIGVFSDDGSLICHIAVVDHGSSIHYVGLFITKTSYRGRGIGRKVLNHIINSATAGQTMIMDSVSSKSQFYEQFGFILENISKVKLVGYVRTPNLTQKMESNYQLVKVTSHNIDAVLSYDQKNIQESRVEFIKGWISANDSTLFSCLDVSKNVCGYIVLRQTTASSFKMGGFYADTTEIAKQLLIYALSHLPLDASITCRVPSNNLENSVAGGEESLDRVECHDEKEHCALVMSRGNNYPTPNWKKIFAVTNCLNTFI